MNRTLLTGALACIILLLTSCGDEPPVPSYIHIPAITVATDYGTQGSNSAKVTDAWVYINDQLIGVFNLPATFPVQYTGTTEIKIAAGIMLNGISSTRAAYPLYRDTVITVELEETKTDTINPVVRYYYPAPVFVIQEDFETGNQFNNNLEKISGSEVKEGSFSGKIETNTTGRVQVVSDTRYTVPYNTPAVFLEMDYKNTHVFNVGINMYKDGLGIALQKITLSPKEDWNKVYINFTPEVTQNQADEYEITFTVDSSNVSAATGIYLDNIKLVYFP